MNRNYVSEKINSFLSRPYPLLLAQKDRWLYVCIISIIIALLINLEQPFGLHGWIHPYKGLILCGFGCTYALTKVIFFVTSPRIFPNHFSPYNWTLGKEISTILMLLIFTAALNWIHAVAAISIFNASWYSFFCMQYYTIIFGTPPAVTLGLFVMLQHAHNSKSHVAETNNKFTNNECDIDKATHVQINGKFFAISDILYIEANQNYVEIHSVYDGSKQKQLCRTTIKHVESLLNSSPHFVRCHKSFLVNIQKVSGWKGNSDKIVLQLEECTEKVPVSRNFVPRVKKILSEKA